MPPDRLGDRRRGGWRARRRWLRLARTVLACAVVATLAFVAVGRGSAGTHAVAVGAGPTGHRSTAWSAAPPFRTGGRSPAGAASLAGMPPLIDGNIYAADRAGMLSPTVAGFPSLVYVPNDKGDTLSVVDPRSYRVIATFPVGCNPQHVVPSWDLKTLWVLNDHCNSVTALDPATGRPGRTIPVDDPYNLYFTPDGRYAIVVSEARQRLVFRDPHTMAAVHSVPLDCLGVDHMDFTADGRFAIASCEFSGRLAKVDIAAQKLVGYLDLGARYMPQDVKSSPDGRVFYVADQTAGGVWEIDPASFARIGFVPTGLGPHGLYPSRDGTQLYVSNRGLGSGHGSVSVISFTTGKVVATWPLAGRTSPDMGGVSADGKVLWLSGRYDGAVYAVSTTDGRLLARIPVGAGPHGLCVYPQPGRYSTGHTGDLR